MRKAFYVIFTQIEMSLVASVHAILPLQALYFVLSAYKGESTLPLHPGDLQTPSRLGECQSSLGISLGCGIRYK